MTRRDKTGARARASNPNQKQRSKLVWVFFYRLKRKTKLKEAHLAAHTFAQLHARTHAVSRHSLKAHFDLFEFYARSRVWGSS